MSREEFLAICKRYREAREQLNGKPQQTEFVYASLVLQFAKGQVPKSWWRWAR